MPKPPMLDCLFLVVGYLDPRSLLSVLFTCKLANGNVELLTRIRANLKLQLRELKLWKENKTVTAVADWDRNGPA